MSKFLRYSAIILSLALVGCFSSKKDDGIIKVGVTAGPHIEVMEYVQGLAKEEGLNVEIVEFNDFILPNIALNDGDLDINSYQHGPFLEDQKRSRGYEFVDFGKTLLMPMGVYSRKFDDMDKIGMSARVAIPNDPTNGGRALLLLESLGLIELKDGVDHRATVLDIIENPKNLKIIELEAPQLPRVLQDVDAAVINTDWAIIGGLNPSEDTIAVESLSSPYANIFVVREEDEENEQLEHFVDIYQSDETKQFVLKRFNGAVIPAW